METPPTQWQVLPSTEIPQWFIEAVRRYCKNSDGRYAAQLLWHRGIQDPLKLPGYLDPDAYQPSSPFEFGEEMSRAIARLTQAREKGEKVTIWGDFDADGVTSTSLLWEGLGEFFEQNLRLNYYIPNRLTESHGLNLAGIDRLAATGTTLIVTCDTGSTNLAEIEYAKQLGIDLIVTDHHTLPEQRPPVVAIINPRYLSPENPLYHLSGVAVAYKLIEALYQTLPDVPQKPLENLLDLVAIGLIADLVQLQGDCRYLAQRGIKQLQKQTKPEATRPGVYCLLELCKRNGDRPTDISFGLGPRINAVSRIHGDASFCVELLTSRNLKRCQALAFEAELANTRRKSLQNDVIKQVKQKLARIDLSTTSVIVLEDSQWQGGVLGLVAGQIAQEYSRPTILLSSSGEVEADLLVARGSARSINQIDLYQLVKSQAHLLHRFGGHPFAAGLSLPVENIPLLREGINQQLRQQLDSIVLKPTLVVDLTVTVAELGKNLFNELSLIEPCGMGNSIPQLLIKNCWFKKVRNKNIQDQKGQKIQYIRTTFELWDRSVTKGFFGVWWGHYQDEIPQDVNCDVVLELYFNSNAYKYKTESDGYEVRLVAVQPSQRNIVNDRLELESFLIDRRNQTELPIDNCEEKIVDKCPQSWQEIYQPYRSAIASKQKLILAYSFPDHLDPQVTWQQLIGITKYLIRTEKTVTKKQIQAKLSLSNRSWSLALKALQSIGINHQVSQENYTFSWANSSFSSQAETDINNFLVAVAEEQFQKQYFATVPLSVIGHQLFSNIEH